MVKLVFCAKRLPHLSRDDFQKYWRDHHGPLVRAAASALGIRRYVQVHTMTTPLNERLRSALGTRVQISRRGKGGALRIAFATEAELNRLFARRRLPPAKRERGHDQLA